MDKKFRIPRVWSNIELKKFSQLFHGKIVNVSGWQDNDKQGHKYKSYFANASEYWITNYLHESRGFQGDLENEIFLDLTKPLSEDLKGAFDIVLNHTVIEHIFELNTAFENLCSLSRDIVILVVPFLQEQHGIYGDYWRFSPQAIDKLFQLYNFKTLYLNYNDESNSSIYIFAIGSRKPINWLTISNHEDNKLDRIYKENIGTHVFQNRFLNNLLIKFSHKILRE